MVSGKPSRPPEVRLQKYLASCGLGSRRGCEQLIIEGRVSLDGRIVTEMGTLCNPETQSILVDGRSVSPDPFCYYLLNKPTGILCTSDDPAGRTTFLSLLPKDLPRVYTVGRLDRDSEGLLLITNDGELAHRLMHPRYEVHKTYHVWVDRELTRDEVQRALAGVWDGGERLAVVSIQPLPSPRHALKYEIVLGEGRNRHIRRLMQALRLRVIRLRRVSLGPLALGALREGKYRVLTQKEIGALQQAAAQRSAAPSNKQVTDSAG